LQIDYTPVPFKTSVLNRALYFNGELKEEDGIVLAHKSTQQLKLSVPK
jgi:hypothetical protein